LPIIYVPSTHDANGENDFETEMDIYTRDIVITGSQDTTAKSWSLETGACLRTFHGHIGAVLCLATDSRGKILFTGSGDNSIRLWDIQRGTELRVFDQHQGAVIHLLVGNNVSNSCITLHYR
jgi:WD repeat-containing protein 86